jgi:hypothetical protein
MPFVLFAGVILTCFVAIPRIASPENSPSAKEQQLTSPTEEVFLDFARASELLEEKKPTQAKAILDRVCTEKLSVESFTGGRGALKTFSPTTLLMRLGRLMAREARTAAFEGNNVEALVWISRCRELAAQVLLTADPTLDVLNMARYLDLQAGSAEIDVRKMCCDEEGVKRVSARESALHDFYRTDIQKRVMELPENSGRDIDKMSGIVQRYQAGRLSVTAMTENNRS